MWRGQPAQAEQRNYQPSLNARGYREKRRPQSLQRQQLSLRFMAAQEL